MKDSWLRHQREWKNPFMKNQGEDWNNKVDREKCCLLTLYDGRLRGLDDACTSSGARCAKTLSILDNAFKFGSGSSVRSLMSRAKSDLPGNDISKYIRRLCLHYFLQITDGFCTWNFNHKDFFLSISKNETVDCDNFSHGHVQLHSWGPGGVWMAEITTRGRDEKKKRKTYCSRGRWVKCDPWMLAIRRLLLPGWKDLVVQLIMKPMVPYWCFSKLFI